MNPRQGKFRVVVDEERCKACGICIKACPKNVFDQREDGLAVVAREEDCIGCHICDRLCPDFAITVVEKGDKPLSDEEATKLNIARNYVRSYVPRFVWCPGCGIGIVFQGIVRAVHQLGIPKDKIVMVSGIGCTGRMPGYADFNTLHTTHGRALAFATGIKLANPELHVIVVMGDGDSVAIGGNHFIHAARRNLDVTAVVINNGIYGMTGGQVAPTTPTGQRATTAPYGNPEPPFDICKLAEGAGANFVARLSTHQAYMPIFTKIIAKAIQKEGFSLVEVLSQCPTYYGRFNIVEDPYKMLQWLKEHTYMKGRKPKHEGDFVLGVLYESDREGLVKVLNRWREEKINASAK